ncbi:uncharacterized protein LOC129615342 [Condylostylus longicornis]|uniref:uncharacterized protein LOC129615342 n=1 Tax=Condylostylus longicornis TaxID=2530218 RepID=UPI00244D9CDE|nr:uncharacterized protein LOC129615342 [Condylostylus longicornis]
MFNLKIFTVLVLCSIIVNSEAGVFDWFRSKPTWYNLIDKYPLIEAFHPKGLRVSISDVDGMEIFGFHGNLNQCFKRNEPGILYGNVTKPTNGRWVFIDENIELKKDDALHYWIYVKLNGEEYSFSKNVFVIRNLIPHPGNLYLLSYIDERIDKGSNRILETLPNEEKLCKCPVQIPTFSPVPITTTDNSNYVTSGTGVAQNIPVYSPIPETNYNYVQPGNNKAEQTGTTYNPVPVNQNLPSENLIETLDIQSELLTCSFQVDSLNEVILDLLKDTNMHSKLVLVGKPQTRNSAIDEVRRFLVQFLELYDLGIKIKKAEYLPCGILFEMSSIIDKKRILLRASTDMRNVECKFLEPEVAGCF